MALKIIGAGFGRTGTLSMKAALEKLGFVKTHHMLEVMPDAKQRRLWLDIARGQKPDWDAIFDGYQACVDFPASSYYPELMAHYPDAKVVLTVRDFEKWYKSVSETIYKMRTVFPAWMIRIIPPLRHIAEMVDGTVWNRVFDGRFTDKEHMRQIFEAYIGRVKHDVPPEKLLIFNVGEGWRPLCAFLECDIPDEPFPRLNDTDSMKRAMRRIRTGILAFYILIAAAVAALIFSAG